MSEEDLDEEEVALISLLKKRRNLAPSQLNQQLNQTQQALKLLRLKQHLLQLPTLMAMISNNRVKVRKPLKEIIRSRHGVILVAEEGEVVDLLRDGELRERVEEDSAVGPPRHLQQQQSSSIRSLRITTLPYKPWQLAQLCLLLGLLSLEVEEEVEVLPLLEEQVGIKYGFDRAQKKQSLRRSNLNLTLIACR